MDERARQGGWCVVRRNAVALAGIGIALVACSSSGTATVDAGPHGVAHDGGVDAHALGDARPSKDAHDARPSDAPSVKDAHSPGDAMAESSAKDASIADAGPDNPCLPFTMPAADALFGSSKKVFAHYFYPFPLSEDNQPSATDYYNEQYLTTTGESDKWIKQGGYLRQRPLPVPVGASATYQIDNMKREVELAIAGGITGFTIDVLGASQANAGSQLANLLTAATAVDSRFKIVVMPDASALSEADAGGEASEVEAIIASVASSPAAYRLGDGRLVVSSFYAELQPPSWWTTVLQNLAGRGINVAFVPVFLNYAANQAAFTPISYGLSLWGTATPGAATSTQALPGPAHTAGEIFMMPILSQQYRPKDFLYWESGNSETLRDAWTSAIQGGADWTQIVTWSDFSESGEIEPFTDSTLAPDIGTGYYDVNAYYASWFLTGQAPTITSDVLYYFYRREPTSAVAPAQAQATTVQGGTVAENDIELLAFLKAPGTLTITVGGQTSTQVAPAGITSLKMALQPGTPTFTLARGGASIVSFQGGIEIYGDGGLPSGVLDLTYWSGSASASGTCALTVP
jgi:hypothetical protein